MKCLPQRPGIVTHHQGSGSALRVAHQQVAAVGHDRYQDGLGTGCSWPDAVPDAARHVVVVVHVCAVTALEPLKALVWLVVPVLHVFKPPLVCRYA